MIEDKLLQLEKAKSPILSTEFPISMELSELQPENVYLFILITELGIVLLR